jgi:enoyl-CoA hydratase/carnithine racemase
MMGVVTVRYRQLSERIGELVLSRPPVNALTIEMVHELSRICDDLADNLSSTVLLVTSDQPHFCAGADLKERATIPEHEIGAVVGRIRDCFAQLDQLPQITIAGLNGKALGGGLELALACDLRIMATDAVVGLAEVGLGIMPGAGGTQRLPRLVGDLHAKDLILTGRQVDASSALAMGLVNQVVAADQLGAKVSRLGELVARNAPLALRAAKQAIHAARDLPMEAGLEREAAAYATLIPTADRLEGIAAFQAKRPPKWAGR